MLYDFSEEKTVDPKLYKATLCQFYLKGPCKNGDKCNYAHGTSELRIPMGGSVADLEASTSEKKSLFKTTLCAKFVTYGKPKDILFIDCRKFAIISRVFSGDCPFGPACHYAHGVVELRAALAASAKNVEKDDESAKNPAFKTSLCNNYMIGKYCSYADKCVYAHVNLLTLIFHYF